MWTKSTRAVVVTALAVGGAAGVLAVAAPDASAGPPASTTFHALTPTRLFDTRTGVPQGALDAGTTMSYAVTGAHGSITVPAAATSVVLNVTANAPTAPGSITVFQGGTTAPLVSSLNFVKGQTVPNQVIAPVSASGTVSFLNRSVGSVQLITDITGYFALSDGNAQGTYSSTTPTRLLDTRIGTGATKAAVGPRHSVTFTVTGGTAGVPAGVSAVALNITETQPGGPGFVTAYAAGAPLPTASNLNFATAQTVPNLAIVPVSASGKVTLYNGSSTGSVQLLADLQGYFMGGDPISAGALGALAPSRLLDTRVGTGAAKAAVAANGKVTFTVDGHGGAPLTGVAAVVLNITVTGATKPGFITAYSGPTQPLVSNLNFVASRTVANLAVVPLSNGTVTLFNGSSATVQLIADVSGYLRTTDLPLPPTSTARYVRNLHTAGGSVDLQTMQAEGCNDAASPFVVLDIGAQLNNETGVELSATAITLSYPQLVTDVNNYLAFYKSCGSGGKVALATNNSAEFTTYTAAERGADWANKVLDAVAVPSGVTVYGADDIESGFAFTAGEAGSTEAQAQQWVTAYLGATSHNFVFIGSADGCPTAYGATGGVCDHNWTEANYYALSRGLNPSRITALPQIYTPALAVQWANIAKTGGSAASIVGALTEYTACPTGTSPDCDGFASLPPRYGWAALFHTVSTQFSTVSLPYVADLENDTEPVSP